MSAFLRLESWLQILDHLFCPSSQAGSQCDLEEIFSLNFLLLFSRVRLFATPWTAAHPGFPVLHRLLELAQTHVHGVSDTIQPSRPLSSPSPPTFNLSQHQGLFQWVSSSHHMAKVLTSVLPMNIQGWFPSGLIGLISLLSKGLSRVFSNTTVWKALFFTVLWLSAFFMV